ncbi:hypothetical protein FE257_000568 [Aspergillus nanangensis]|uniref:Cytochrome P450 n=1 Tax=Aspergillus nanangensis TaxID=2582783 RepID=A0AAD4GXK5_ASPNN|nr:hypothetical protein FE257_000568 [Aspergillus nanangensis]
MSREVPIPSPRGLPLLGNIRDVDPTKPLQSFHQLADTHGPIFRLTMLNRSRVFVSSHELVDELCDEDRFAKLITGGLEELRHALHDGLLTADHPNEANWEIAHRILRPVFGPQGVEQMYDDMYDCTRQLALKWARSGHQPSAIPVVADFTRLTLDILGVCTMGSRFHAIEHEQKHPCIDALDSLLQLVTARVFRPFLVNSLSLGDSNKFWKDIKQLRHYAQQQLDARRQHPQDKQDVLNGLVLGRDPQTGRGLSDESIVDNMLTFLIAGHETTAAMLSFLFYYLLKHPETYRKAREEVDRTVGRRKLTVADLAELPYITAAMRETLRLSPPSPMIAVHAHPTRNQECPVVLGDGKWALKKNEPVVLLVSKLQRDPGVYGDDADQFRPERMLDGGFEKLLSHTWMPFGNGGRGCIGRGVAWQEGLLVTAVLHFDLAMDDVGYELQVRQTGTMMPEGFQMRATLRSGMDEAME